MTTIVISDIHNRTRWIEDCLKHLKEEMGYDEVVFLGDYFDQFNDTPYDVGGTAHWLKQSLKHEDRIHLLGNHDMSYRYPKNDSVWCPGFTDMKNKAVNNVLTREDWNKTRPAYFTQGWLLSHAGFSEVLMNHPIKGIPTPQEMIEKAEQELDEKVRPGLYSELFSSGARMLNVKQLVGGITWLDWSVEFRPIEGINQIVGHTPDKEVRTRGYGDSQNICLDTHNKHIGIIQDGDFRRIINNIL